MQELVPFVQENMILAIMDLRRRYHCERYQNIKRVYKEIYGSANHNNTYD